MTLISIHGPLGSGKTLLLTWLSVWNVKYRKTGLYANYKINIPEYNEIFPEMLVNLPAPCVVALHEAYSWLESRGSGSSVMNNYMSYILFESRKQQMDFIIDDQLLSTIDVRFRMLTDIDITCRKRADGFHYTICTEEVRRKTFLSWSDAKKIFPYYSTFQRPNTIDKEMIAKISVNQESIMKEVDETADKILGMYAMKDCTHAVIDDYCIRNNISNEYNKRIYNAIRGRKVCQKEV